MDQEVGGLNLAVTKIFFMVYHYHSLPWFIAFFLSRHGHGGSRVKNEGESGVKSGWKQQDSTQLKEDMAPYNNNCNILRYD